ncbi:MAG: flagellar motor switch protein FliG [Chloroflexi bacterium]|nr:flagellar motor switch protein FliG [Chloroflexota bacterium]
MAADSTRNLSGRQKAAALLISLGTETSASILKALPQELLEQITVEITRMREVPPDVADVVAREATGMATARRYIAEGGLDYARDMLTRALGQGAADDVIRRSRVVRQPFDFVRDTDPTYLVNFLQNEHPQTIALVLAHLEPPQTANLLSRLQPELRSEVARRMATMERTAPDVISELEELLRAKLASVLRQGTSTVGGVEYVVQVLNQVDRSTERTILDIMEEADPLVADAIKNKMFVFDNIGDLDDRAIQRVLREVDSKDLALSLRGGNDKTRQRILGNMSTRSAQMLNEEMEIMGPVRVSAVDEAQQRIVNAVRRLEELEEITIARGEEDQLLV